MYDMAKKASKKAISQKIGYLIHEGKKPEQAVAIAHSMARAGRLTSEGRYVRKPRKAKKGK